MIRIREHRWLARVCVFAAAISGTTIVSADNGTAEATPFATASAAWVTATPMMNLPVGTRSSIPTLVSAPIDAVGRYTIEIPATREVLALAEPNGGVLNIEVDFYAAQPDVVLWGVGVVPLHNVEGTFVPVEGRAWPAATLDYSAPLSPDASLDLASAPAQCVNYVDAVAKSHSYTKVGEVHSAYGMETYFEYGEKADSEIEVGISNNGSDWRTAVGSKMSNNIGFTVRWNASGWFGRQALTEFQYGKYERHTVCPFISKTTHTIRADQWNGGQQWGMDVSGGDGPTAYNSHKATATEYQPTGQVWKNAGKNRLYNAAVEVFGLSLRATSGYSSNVDHYWVMSSRADIEYFLFGTDSKPSTAQTVYANSRTAGGGGNGIGLELDEWVP